MKHYYTHLLLVIILISGCKKENEHAPPVDSGHIPRISYNTLNVAIDSLQYHKPIQLDLNKDEIIDYNLSSVLLEENDLPYMYLFIRGDSRAKNQVMVKDGPELTLAGFWASPLNNAVEIHNTPATGCRWNGLLTKAFFLGLSDDGTNKVFSGEWIGKQDKYLALKFSIAGNYHYGWLRVSHTIGQERLIITDYAYNREAGHSIMAGQR